MTYDKAEQMAVVGFVVRRDGVTMTGVGDDAGFVQRVGQEWEAYEPTDEDKSATDWSLA